jgi:hypothetical protein
VVARHQPRTRPLSAYRACHRNMVSRPAAASEAIVRPWAPSRPAHQVVGPHPSAFRTGRADASQRIVARHVEDHRHSDRSLGYDLT